MGIVLVVGIVVVLYMGYTGLFSNLWSPNSVSTSTVERLAVPAVETAIQAVGQIEKQGSEFLDEAEKVANEKREKALRNALEPLYPITIGTVGVEASVADDPNERRRGLSGTLGLPDGVVKLFIFATAGPQGIWMKDMQYPIDIMWLDAAGMVIHIEQEVRPESYPKSFASPVPALYVIEAEAGFVERYSITLGTATDLSSAIASR